MAADGLGWILGVVVCIALPLALGYYSLALAGGGGLAVLWAVIFRCRDGG